MGVIHGGTGGIVPLKFQQICIYRPPSNPPPPTPHAAYHCMVFGNPAKPIVCLLSYTVLYKKSLFQLKVAVGWIGGVGACHTALKF